MQKKTLLSACIALALSGSGWAADIDDTDSATRQRKETRIPCPTAHSSEKLSPQQLKSLPSECSTTNDNNLYSLIAVGATSLITTLAVLELNHDDGNHAHSSDNPPVPPDDDNGGNTPDDGGNTPDDGGNTPDDGGNTPDDGGNTPDDGGNTPDDGGNTPDDGGNTPDDGGNTPDDGGNTPDDGGNVTPPKEPKIFNNNVTFDEDKGTLKIRNATFTYSKNTDGTYTLTAGDGRTTVVQGWDVDTAANTVEITGVNTQGGMTWRYGKDGIIYITKTVGATVDDPANSNVFNLSDAVLTDQGGNAARNGATVIEINGSRIVLNNDGDISATGKDSVVVAMTGNDITVNNNGHMVVDGGTAGVVNGDRAILNNRGDAVITNGGAGVIVTGDNAVINNTGQSDIDGDNSVSVKVAGNATRIKMEGGLNVSGGAHGIDATGDNNEVSNKGNISVVDAHSMGVLLNGDRASFVNMGDINVSGGAADDHAIGVQINGDNSTFINVGDLNADDTATGVKITGDASDIALAGAMHVGNFASGLEVTGKNNDLSLSTNMMDVTGKQSTGVTITGDDNTIDITGDMVVDQNSVGAKIAGDRVSLQQKGDITVNGAGHGVEVSGSKAAISNQGKLTVKDQDSIGIAIIGDDAQFTTVGEIDVSLNGTGVAISGDREQVNLSGDINVIQERDGSGTFQGGTGISIMGNDSSMLLAGNINVTSSMGDQPSTSPQSLTGVTIGGENNTVDLQGDINITVDSDFLEPQNDLYGVMVSGSNNIINLDGGINISGDSGGHFIKGVQVTGNNSVNISGHSVMNTRQVLGTFSLISVADGGNVVFDESAVTDIQSSTRDFPNYFIGSVIIAMGSQSAIRNNGIVNTTDAQELMMANSGGQVVNAGEINIRPDAESHSFFAGMAARGDDSQAKNVSGGTINLTSNTQPYRGSGIGEYPVKWYSNTGYALLASNYGTVINETGATINLHGAGTYGVSASKGTATNAGEINVDGFVPTVDENGFIIDETYWQTNSIYLMGGGMLAGSTDAGNGDAKAVNTGTINVNNEGFGMLAMSGGTVVNQGTINLTTDEGVTKQQDNQLFAMGAVQGGLAINDQDGVININTDIGQAFYKDSTGTILNYGKINLFGNPMDESDSHMGVTPDDKDILSELSGSGESISKTTTGDGFIAVNNQANYGDETLNGDVTANGWIFNQPDASLTINGELSVNQGLENSGHLDVDSINSKTTIYNRETGSITTDLLTLNGAVSFFNEGEFSGSITGNSYQQNVVNTGEMTVTEDGHSLVNGSFLFFNEAGATLTNSGNAVTGGENAIIHVTRTSDSVSQVNRGTITATNGYSAIKTENTGSNSNGKWIWNTETGVINGINPVAPLVDLRRGYNFSNAGVINVQGDNAVGISGGTTSYTVKLVNSGTINVGTEQGQLDGTNGEGLIGIKGNGKDTTINNTQTGVINVYADNSWAFGGQTKAIINNGEINLLCDTGCDIYAPGTTGTQKDHNGTADITVPEASTTPSQGNVPTPPADPNAPQLLSNYTIGTNSDGSSGTLSANNLVIGDNVSVNAGFSAGTADTTVVVNDVFKGENISGVDNIVSSTVVWTAKGSTDASGNVDVTMSKNAYTDVATDGSVSDVAKALDAGYTNNELYTSLNVGTTAELNSALKQISGSQATTVFREARVLSNRFSMLADAAPKMGNGLAFNVVAKGDPRAELGNNTEYDMLALRKTVDLSESQTMSLEYGIARLDGDGAQKAGDNGVTGGYSQFFGLKHQMSFDNGMNWNNALRYDIHQLDSSRSVAYGDVSKTADTNVKQQYLEFRSEGAKTFEPREGLKITPYAGLKLRHTLEGGYQERNAGDFNLSMNSGSETAMDSIVGLKLDYAGKDGWSANATLEGGPNLSYAKSQRTASLAGAGSQHFNVDDGQKGGSINSLASVGVKYSSKESSLNLDAYHWKEDGVSDKGVMLNFKKTF
ncbi:autotransporter outer membrane beta-barrel domain-containing protein [Escherichia coli]|uniref:BigA/YdbA N-terminal beta-barrel domain-containing protein n=5 Tax=Escherichia coli TaxID=562 RepID=UPI000390ED6B|nr:autotransporter outer membrane beta-barrel domain-containing protein [Escherichia coli]EFZ4855714.1 autotransporter domain-containing protein [Shigella sonnei]AXZ43606.1 autotransporter domain-containing protein [Escherichia coli]EEY5386550.1 autotransporter domain-containing protein [Escherichia coli]EEY6866985.1 autotransporter domain-containing protein [Escherichia coli]EFK3623979.1 autotransporter domain-containing protein [Escherichia coli]